MLNDSNLSNTFWTQVIHIGVHILNRAQIRTWRNMTPYELWKGRPTTFKHFCIFGSKFYIKINDEKLEKFDSRYDEGIFLGYCWP